MGVVECFPKCFTGCHTCVCASVLLLAAVPAGTAQCRGPGHLLWSQNAWVGILALGAAGCITLSNLCGFGVPQFPLLQHGVCSSVPLSPVTGMKGWSTVPAPWALRPFSPSRLSSWWTCMFMSLALPVCCNSGSLPGFFNTFLNIFSNNVIFFEVRNFSTVNRCPSFWCLPLLWSKSYILSLFLSVFI